MSDSEDEVTERQFKICLIGNSQAGKTSIVTRYTSDTFTKNCVPTVGVEFYLKRTVLQGNRHVTLKIWDIGGTGALQGNMLDKYAFGAHAIMLVYDVTNGASFDQLSDWLRAVKNIASMGQGESPTTQGATGGPSPPTLTQQIRPTFALVANKIDQEHLRVIKSERHHKFAQENGLLTYAMAAKSGEGVNLCFQKIAAELLGIRLTKAEQEHHQKVVKAEIVTYPQNRILSNPQSVVKTAVCCLQ